MSRPHKRAQQRHQSPRSWRRSQPTGYRRSRAVLRSTQIKAMYANRGMKRSSSTECKTIAARLSEAKQTIPHFYLRREIRLDSLLAFRSQLQQGAGVAGVKLSVNDFVIKSQRGRTAAGA